MGTKWLLVFSMLIALIPFSISQDCEIQDICIDANTRSHQNENCEVDQISCINGEICSEGKCLPPAGCEYGVEIIECPAYHECIDNSCYTTYSEPLHEVPDENAFQNSGMEETYSLPDGSSYRIMCNSKDFNTLEGKYVINGNEYSVKLLPGQSYNFVNIRGSITHYNVFVRPEDPIGHCIFSLDSEYKAIDAPKCTDECTFDGYQCNGDQVEYCWVANGCKKFRVEETCTGANICKDGNCVTACEAKSICVNDKTIAYQYTDCSLSEESNCDGKCQEGVCTPLQGCSNGYTITPCNANEECIENKCYLKEGCTYNNPVCKTDETCTNNVCIKKSNQAQTPTPPPTSAINPYPIPQPSSEPSSISVMPSVQNPPTITTNPTLQPVQNPPTISPIPTPITSLITTPTPSVNGPDIRTNTNRICYFWIFCRDVEIPTSQSEIASQYPLIIVHGLNVIQIGKEEGLVNLQSSLSSDGLLENKGKILSSSTESICIDGWPKSISVNFLYYENGYNQGIDSYANKLSKVVDLVKKCTSSEKVNIVAHSMGGLVSRQYMLTGSNNVNKLIMLETPNYGSSSLVSGISSNGVLGTDAAQMVPGSTFLINLNKNDCNNRGKMVNLATTTLFGEMLSSNGVMDQKRMDKCIQFDLGPASLFVTSYAAFLEGASNHEISSCKKDETLGHTLIAEPYCKESYDIIKKYLL